MKPNREGHPDRPTPTQPLQGIEALDVTGATSRRKALVLIGGAGLGVIAAACGGSKAVTNAASSADTTASTAESTTTTAAASTVASAAGTVTEVIPEETGGPYPGDGSNGVNVLTQDGVVRRDIRSSFGTASGTATGVPLTLQLQVVDIANGSAPLAGAAVYVWHCTMDGEYSMYAQDIADENYLRGVQETDAGGNVSFTTIFPGCYSGRWPHIHFEVYPSVAAATTASGKIATSQLALPKEVCDVVYATDGYSASARNLAQTSLARDMVFSDGADLETPTVTGTTADGYAASLTIGV